MALTCPQCGTIYDVSDYPPGHTFDCQCGSNLIVPQPTEPGATPPIRPADAGLQPAVKALLFIGNICFVPVLPFISLIVWLIIRDDKPRMANDVCKFTWIPVVIAIVLWGLYLVFAIFFGILGELA